MMNQEVLIDSPVSCFVCVGQRALGDLATDAHVIPFVLLAELTYRVITKTFPICQLCKEQAEILIKTAERLNLVIAVVPLDAKAKLMKPQVFKRLSKDGFSCVHRSFFDEEF